MGVNALKCDDFDKTVMMCEHPPRPARALTAAARVPPFARTRVGIGGNDDVGACAPRWVFEEYVKECDGKWERPARGAKPPEGKTWVDEGYSPLTEVINTKNENVRPATALPAGPPTLRANRSQPSRGPHQWPHTATCLSSSNSGVLARAAEAAVPSCPVQHSTPALSPRVHAAPVQPPCALLRARQSPCAVRVC
jgi:hypothetical protein